ncbi:MAG: hypothetical protein FWD48_05215 [Oscillospiraceae bacterium]|nr:hypothetical protein [Oscillospiraceae bacterium]
MSTTVDNSEKKHSAFPFELEPRPVDNSQRKYSDFSFDFDFGLIHHWKQINSIIDAIDEALKENKVENKRVRDILMTTKLILTNFKIILDSTESHLILEDWRDEAKKSLDFLLELIEVYQDNQEDERLDEDTITSTIKKHVDILLNIMFKINFLNKDIEEYSEHINTAKAEVDELLEKQEEIVEKTNDIFNSIKETSSNIKEKEKEINKIREKAKVTLAQMEAGTYSYKFRDEANKSNKIAWFWHILAIVVMLVAVVIAFNFFVLEPVQGADWVQFASRVFTTTTLAAIAIYAARQASKQEAIERYTRNKEMDLEAFYAFVNGLGEDEEELKHFLNKEIAKHIVSEKGSVMLKDKNNSKQNLDKTMVSVEELVKLITKLLGK